MSKLSTFILLDRSGSMMSRWTEALSAINGYVTELKKAKTKGEVTVVAFDSLDKMSFTTLRKAVPVKKFQPLRDTELQPRGMTPLFDAVGRLVSLATKGNNHKTAIVIMTDGHENSSKELKGTQAKALVQQCKDRDWRVVFLGADFDPSDDAAILGVQPGDTLSMTAGTYASTLRSVASDTIAYSANKKDD